MFWDIGTQRQVRQTKYSLNQTKVADHSWFSGILFILLISADSKVFSMKTFRFSIISF